MGALRRILSGYYFLLRTREMYLRYEQGWKEDKIEILSPFQNALFCLLTDAFIWR